MSLIRCLALTALVLCALQCVQASQPSCSAERPTCKACAREGGSNNGNFLGKLPRRDRKFNDVSNNWADYNFLNCTEGSCDFNMPGPDDFQSSTDKNNPYLDSLVYYIAIAIVMAVLCLLWVTCFVFWRYCCCCCCKQTQRCKCGGKYPTRRTFWLGYTHTEGHRFEYSRRGRILSALFVIVFLGMMISFILIAEFKGNKAISSAVSKTATTTLTPFHDLTTSIVGPTTTLIISLASDTITNLLKDLNTTVTSNTDVRHMNAQFVCTLAKIDNFPEIQEIVDVVDNLDLGVTAVNVSLLALGVSLENVDSVNSTLFPLALSSSNYVTLYEGQVQTLQTSATQLSFTLVTIQGLQTSVTGVTGFETTAKADLILYRDNYPSDTTASDTSTMLTDYKNGAYIGAGGAAAAGRAALAANLLSIKDGLTAIDSLTTIATHLTAFNTGASNLQSSALADVFTWETNTKNAVSALLSTAFINATLVTIVDDLNALNLADTKAKLDAVYASVHDEDLIDFDTVRNMLDRIVQIQEILPCMRDAIDEILSLNVSVVSLPSSLADITSLVDEMETSLDPTIAVVNSSKLQITHAQDMINLYNLTAYIEQAVSAQNKINAGIAAMDLPGLQLSLQKLNASLTFDYTSINSVSDFNSTLSTASIPSALIDAFTNGQSAFATLSTYVGKALADVQLLGFGYCQESPSTQCSADGPGCTCLNIGQQRCFANPATLCTANGNCPSGDHCLIDNLDYTNYISAVDAISSNRIDVTTAINEMENVEDACDFDVTPLVTALNNAVSNSSAFDWTAISSSITELQNGLRVADIGGYSSLVSTVVQAVTDITFSETVDQIKGFNSTVHDFKTDKRKLVVQAINGTDAIAGLLYTRMHTYLDDMKQAKLQAAFDQGGLSGMVSHLIGIVDKESEIMALKLAEITTSITKQTFQADFDDSLASRILNVLSLPEYSSHGSMYFFGQMYQAYENDSLAVLPHWYPNTFDVFHDTDGKRYVNDAYCLTDTCVKNFVSYFNTAKLSQRDYGMVKPPVPLSRENLFELLLILPAIVVIFGIWGLLCPVSCCCRNNPSWQKVPISWMTGLLCIMMPFIFIFAGFFFVFVIVWSDGCQSYGGLTVQAVNGLGDSLCTDKLNGNGTLTACTLERSQELMDNTYSANVTVNIQEAIVSIITVCPEVASDPISVPIKQVSTQVHDWGHKLVKTYLDENNDGDIRIRQSLEDLALDYSLDLGSKLADYMVDLANSTLTCPMLNSIVLTTQENFCCDLLSSIYWWVGSWYIIAWSMFFCGFTSGALGRKRLPRFPWGPQYEMDVTEIPHVGAVEMVMSPTQLVDTYDVGPDGIKTAAPMPDGMFPGAALPNANYAGISDIEYPMFDNQIYSHPQGQADAYPRDPSVHPNSGQYPHKF